ncbi:hypothetical protein [Streptosporangium sp. NPDC000239]|uniref:Uncharacterized protein n=1 Tax=Streptosporangium jomthongense TaxID=1193683 RepID=A0ABV8EVS0_9ACTN
MLVSRLLLISEITLTDMVVGTAFSALAAPDDPAAERPAVTVDAGEAS